MVISFPNEESFHPCFFGPSDQWLRPLGHRPFSIVASKQYPPTDPADVGVYRSTHPFPSFIELGAISYRVNALDLVQMYDQIRKHAAEYGAQAVVDIRISSDTRTDFETENRCNPRTSCNADGGCTTEQDCHTEQVPVTITTFLIVGSMIRGKP